VIVAIILVAWPVMSLALFLGGGAYLGKQRKLGRSNRWLDWFEWSFSAATCVTPMISFAGSAFLAWTNPVIYPIPMAVWSFVLMTLYSWTPCLLGLMAVVGIYQVATFRTSKVKLLGCGQHGEPDTTMSNAAE
jgi:hypothetical protein